MKSQFEYCRDIDPEVVVLRVSKVYEIKDRSFLINYLESESTVDVGVVL
ncbi:MAG TPA: hypothetical protein VM848_08780 [Acidimicrobiia bacterium]|nr:hypothetical protein [Acidimicrobiia bacterium]